jgi:hypothetical protein
MLHASQSWRDATGGPMAGKDARRRLFWVVSPNVGNHSSYWRQASVACEAAFMGYRPDNQKHKQIGYKFAHVVRPNDIMLIARRHRGEPEVVGFGVVVGKFQTSLKDFKPQYEFGSLRKLSPFKPRSAAPPKLLIMNALGQTTALRKLHPHKNPAHRLICEWMERELAGKAGANMRRLRKPEMMDAQLANLPHPQELEYEVRTRRKTVLAKKREDELVSSYRVWLEDQQRELSTMIFKNLRCDAYEEERNNLIEAKCSTKREYIRMAVGQLLDYAYLGRKRFGKPNMAILLPKKPDPKSVQWLSELKIKIIWKEKDKFVDNANKRFT